MSLLNNHTKRALLAACFAVQVAVATGKTWHVRPAGHSSIGQAVRDAAAGDTIVVAAGTYREKNLVINKPLYLKGINYPVLDGEKQYEIILVQSNRVTIEGFDIRHSGYSSYNDIAAVRINNARQVTIRNNRLSDNFFGIYCQHAGSCVITGNTLHAAAASELSSGNGIHCWKSDSLLIAGNTVSGHRDGIYFEFVTASEIRDNYSHHNIRYGLHFMFSNDDSYRANRFENNGAGVAVMFSRGVTMMNNTFAGNWGAAAYGILLKEITDSRISLNHFIRNTTALYMEGTSRIGVSQNRFMDNGWALKIQASCNDNTITGNNFMGNTFDVATNGSLVLNSFNGNYWDKYEGYDLNRDGTGDVPYRPVSLYAMVVEKNPTAMMLFRSFMVGLFDKTEKVLPGLTPENLKDDRPSMKPLNIH